ncbi:MAG: hypothetical protein NOU37_05125 [Candidatus Brocadiales bacterium]|nr:hypothetical protein [Candidatus Bathyanammoxibius amoris]
MLWRYAKKFRKATKNTEGDVYGGPGVEAFEKARLAEESPEGEEDVIYQDEMVEEGLKRAPIPAEEEEEGREKYHYEYEEVESPGGIYISDKKITGGFTKFGISLLSLVLLPWILAFGISIVAIVSMIVFPVAMSLFPIFLVSLFVLVIVAPLIMPLLIIYLLVTERGKLLINSEGKLFSFVFITEEEEEEALRRPETPEETPASEEHLYEEHLHEEHLH